MWLEGTTQNPSSTPVMTGNSLIVLWLEGMAANLREPSSILGEDPKRFQDSSNYVFYIVGECFSSAAGTHLATDLTCTV